jgi:outer membrane lipoprotein-sorting protein
MKTPIVSKFILLFVFSIFLQSCTADALPEDPAARIEKTVVKPTNVSAEVAGETIIGKTRV